MCRETLGEGCSRMIALIRPSRFLSLTSSILICNLGLEIAVGVGLGPLPGVPWGVLWGEGGMCHRSSWLSQAASSLGSGGFLILRKGPPD